jgi:hypothetical protein
LKEIHSRCLTWETCVVLPLPPTNMPLFTSLRKSETCSSPPLRYPPSPQPQPSYSSSGPHPLSQALLALSQCTHQVNTAYTNLCLDKTVFLNLGCSLLLLLPYLNIHCPSCHYLCFYCLVLTSRNPVRSQIRCQTPHAPAKQLPQGHF